MVPAGSQRCPVHKQTGRSVVFLDPLNERNDWTERKKMEAKGFLRTRSKDDPSVYLCDILKWYSRFTFQ